MRVPVALMLLSACLGCPGGIDIGDVYVVIDGEDAAVDGFAAEDVADGWAISFDRVLVSVGHVTMDSEDGGEPAVLEVDTAVDLHTENGAAVVESANFTPGRWAFGFDIAPPSADADGMGASDELLTHMHENDYALWIEGEGEKDNRIVRFEVGFPLSLELTDCTNGTDDTQGIVVESGGAVGAEITAHLEHLFYDGLGGHAGVELRFDGWADAGGGDGLVDTEDLENALLMDYIQYDPGSEPVDNLHDFAVVAVSEMFHLNGEGLCTINGEVHDHDDE